MAEFLNSCPNCKSNIGRVVERFSDRNEYYYIAECANEKCLSTFINPVLSELESAKLYNTDFEDFKFPTKSEIEQKISAHGFIADLVSGYLTKKSTILDFGCGLGYGLASLKRSGFNTIGIDSSTERIKIANKISESDIFLSLSNIDKRNKAAGVILWHVLEHIPFPKNFLIELKPFLTKDAHIFIQVPSYEFASQFKSNFRKSELYTDVHVNYFTRYNLTKVLQMAGFTVIDTIIDENLFFITVIGRLTSE